MLSVFPEILFLAPFSALFIRVAVGCVFAYCAWKHAAAGNGARAFGAVEAALAAAFIAGAWVQPAALIGAALCAFFLWKSGLRAVSLGTVLLSLVMCLSLLVTGAGPLAFDLPL